MQSRTARHRLVYPVAAIVAFGLVSVPQSTASVPRLTEVSAIRLQAEVTSLVTGIAGVADAIPPAAVTSSLTPTDAPAAAATTCTYPCTVFDKFLSDLPVDVRNAILPPLIVVAWVIGLVMTPVLLVTSAVFGWPVSLRPAASTFTRQTAPAPAESVLAVGDPVPVPDVSATSSSVPGDTENAADAAVGITSPVDDAKPRVAARGTAPADTSPIESAASPKATDAEVSALEIAAASAQPVDETTPTVTATGDVAPATNRPARTRGRSSAAESTDSDSAPASSRAAKRSAR